MTRILAPILLLTLLFPSLAFGETMDDLIFRYSDSPHYKKFTKVPFSGTVTGQYQGKIKNGKKVGPWVEYHRDGWLEFTGTYKNNKRHGSWVSYHTTGRIQKGTYKNGKKHGSWVSYRHNGQLFQKGTYKNGKKHGPWVRYDKNGKLSSKENYRDNTGGWTPEVGDYLNR